MTIDRRRFLAGCVATATAAAAPSILASPARAVGRPNILLVVTDDQPKETQWAISKTIAWLGGAGTTFSSGHCTTPLCGPSRASIWTGQFAHNHGVLGNADTSPLDHATTIQAQLQGAGYRTGMFGKYLNSWPLASAPPYFDEFGIMTRGYTNVTWNIDGTRRKYKTYTTDMVRDLTLRFMKRSATDPRPWFAVATPFACHYPFTAAATYAQTPVPDWPGRPSVPEDDRSDKPPYVQQASGTAADGTDVRASQLRALLSVDDTVAAFRNQLATLGQLDNTLVLFISDNGYLWADHGLIEKKAPYAPSHEVPFYLSWPAGGYGSPKVDTRITANIDIAPTVLAAAGLTPSAPIDGSSLFETASRDHLLLEHWDGRRWASWYSHDKQYIENYNSTGAVSFREYYDLVNDPFQLNNLLYRATPATAQALGIPQLAADLAADRVS